MALHSIAAKGRDPLEFEVGGGMVIAGFDNGVLGMSVGDKRTVNIPVEEAYGPKNPEMIIEFPKGQGSRRNADGRTRLEPEQQRGTGSAGGGYRCAG